MNSKINKSVSSVVHIKQSDARTRGVRRGNGRGSSRTWWLRMQISVQTAGVAEIVSGRGVGWVSQPCVALYTALCCNRGVCAAGQHKSIRVVKLQQRSLARNNRYSLCCMHSTVRTSPSLYYHTHISGCIQEEVMRINRSWFLLPLLQWQIMEVFPMTFSVALFQL